LPHRRLPPPSTSPPPPAPTPQAFGFTYTVRKADIDEKAIRHDDPSRLVMDLAHAKADAILALLRREAAAAADDSPHEQAPASTSSPSPSSSSAAATGASTTFLITCDQVVVHAGRTLEKPADAAEARAFIAGYATSPAQTVGSVLCTRLGPAAGGGADGSSGAAAGSSGVILKEEARIGALENCTILMGPIPPESVEALIAEGEVLWCAGGLMVEHALVAPHVTGIQGGGEDSVMGLGKEAVMRVIVEAAEA
jgi:septum formation protein